MGWPKVIIFGANKGEKKGQGGESASRSSTNRGIVRKDVGKFECETCGKSLNSEQQAEQVRDWNNASLCYDIVLYHKGAYRRICAIAVLYVV